MIMRSGQLFGLGTKAFRDRFRSQSQTIRQLLTTSLVRTWHLALLLMIVYCAPAAASAPTETERPLRLGLTSSLFKGRNESDIVAALKVWAEVLKKEHNVNMDSNIILFATAEEAQAAVKAKSVDSLTLLLSEYAGFQDGLLSGPFLRDETAGTFHDEFVILAPRSDSAWTWSGLRGKKFGLHDAPNALIASTWLNAQLAEAGLGPLEQISAELVRGPKISSVVLNVFFGKTDACIVSRAGFETMVELNPQVGEKVSIVAASPPIIDSIFCFRKDLTQDQKRIFSHEISQLQNSATGQQVLHVFQADRMAIVTEQEWQRSLNLLRLWQQQKREGIHERSTH